MSWVSLRTLPSETGRTSRAGGRTSRRYDGIFDGYQSGDRYSQAFDEMFDGKAQPRRHYRKLHKELLKLTPEQLQRSKQQADLTFFNQGITFTVYGRNEATERIFPHDLLPRIVSAGDWDTIERGLTQRITALNLFLKDIYYEGRIIQDRVIPGSVIYTCRHFRRQKSPRRSLRCS